jgi:dipeptidyl aminopeptidase/acylaminoacyl peptidase
MQIKTGLIWLALLSTAGLLLAACGGPPPATAVADLATPRFSTALPSLAAPSATLPPTATATATHTPSATPSPTATPHPLSIQALRDREFPGSDVVIEQVLTGGGNYDRYIASYLSDGLKIYALLTVPRGEKPAAGWPVIVFNHGFIPPDVYRTTERYVAYVDNLARAGYIVFRSDYRGHGDSEGEAGGAYSSPDYVVDVLNAVAAMKRFPEADPDRIGMWGHSMGGYITLRSMVVSPDIKAGVIWGGVVGSYADLLAHWRPQPTPGPGVTPTPRRGWRGSFIELYGSPEENPEFWDSISANTYLADISGPVQLHHGEADSSVPVVLSEILYEELQAAGKTAEIYTYAGDDHDITANFTLAMTYTIQFFDTYLKDGL